MNTTEIQLLNPDIANERISMPYPHVELLEPSDAVALVLSSLPKGDLPVICTYQGKQRKIASICKSALVIMALMKVSKLKYSKDANSSLALRTSADIMEVLC